MTWLLTIQRREHHLQGAASLHNAPHIEEIAHSLAQINRFTGHASRPYSVAEHSLLVLDLARQEGASAIVQLGALMHDAHEAYCGDVATPIKWAVGEAWQDFELSMAYQLHNALHLRTVMHSARADIRRWDLVALATERRDLTVFEARAHTPWPILDNPANPVHPSTRPEHQLDTEERAMMTWSDWRHEFIHEYRALRCAVDAAADAQMGADT